MTGKGERETLRALAANRGCRLVASRIRTPGKGDYGRYGLEDAKSGKAVLGIGASGLTATAEEVEAFLRGGTTAGWKRSLSVSPKRKEAATQAPRSARSAAARSDAKPRQPARRRTAVEPEPAAPKVAVREAKPADAAAIATLVNALGYDVTAAEVKRRLAALRRAGEPALAAAAAGDLVGVLTWHVTPVLHRPRPVGRITMLVVDEQRRGSGVGTELVAEAEKRLAAKGCGLVEVTSNRKRLRAHNFYERLGYERTSYRFGKSLRP